MRGGREKPFIALPFGWLMTKPKQEALRIRRAVPGDRPEWLRMRAALWPDETNAKHREEMDEYLRENAAVAYVAARPSGGLAGFVEATIRPHAMRATRVRSATSRAGTSTPTSGGAGSVVGSSVPPSAGPVDSVAQRWDPIVSSTMRSAFGRTSRSGTKSGSG